MKRISFKDSNGLNLTQMVLTGRKTMTRRIVTLPDNWDSHDVDIEFIELGDSLRYFLYNCKTNEAPDIFPKYFPGEFVAIQQAYKDIATSDGTHGYYKIGEHHYPQYELSGAGWNNKMFVRADLMPHHIRIIDVHCEWLQDISDEDCMREGIEWLPDGARLKPYAFYDTQIKTQDGYGWYRDYDTPREAFAALIDKVSGRGTWERNPIVWVYEFELVD